MSKQNFIKELLSDLCTGLASRVIGFFYRIFLSHSIGAQGLGLYQLGSSAEPCTFSTSGIQTALEPSDCFSDCLKASQRSKNIFCTGLLTHFLAFCGSFMDSVYKF